MRGRRYGGAAPDRGGGSGAAGATLAAYARDASGPGRAPRCPGHASGFASTTSVPPAQQSAPSAAPALRYCAELDDPEWGDNERWVWQRLCAGEVADFDKRDAAAAAIEAAAPAAAAPAAAAAAPAAPAPAAPAAVTAAPAVAPRRNPREAGVWDKTRLLSPRFLPTVLYSEPYRSLLPQAGARIAGCWLAEAVDLKGGLALAPLALESCRIDGALDLSDARFQAYLSIKGSVLARPAALSRLRVDGQLLVADTRIAGALALACARIGELALEAATVGGALDLTGAEIAGRLTLRAARIDGALSLDGARIGGGALFERTTLADAANLANVEIAHDLSLANGTHVNGRLTLRGARVRGQIDATEAGFGGPLVTEGLDVTGSWLLRRASFSQRAELTGASIGQTLDLSGARLAGLDLSDTRIGGELSFGSNGNSPTWGAGARLTLLRTQAEAFLWPFDTGVADGNVARRAIWPPAGGVDLAGFAYRRLADAMPGEAPPTLAGRLAWLALDDPYQQLATALRVSGADGDARSVLYAGKERARAEAWASGALGTYAAATLLKMTVGYGLGGKTLRALGWALALTGLGAFILWRVPATRPRGMRWMLLASLDHLLPLIEFDREHGAVIARDLGRFGRAYFRLHQLLGWLLAILALAALAGLTQG